MPTIYKSAAGAHAIDQHYGEILDAWPTPSEHVRVPTSQGETFVVAFGPVDGIPVIALHGSGANAAAWLPYSTPWSRHLRVYAVDVIGEPGRSATSRPPLGSAAYTRWLDEVLDGLGLDTVALVGMSLGGLLAVDYASQRTNRVRALALLIPAGISRLKLSVVIKLGLLSLLGQWGKRQSLRIATGTPKPTTPADSAAEPEAEPVELEFATLIFQHFKPRTKLPVLPDDTLRQLTMPVHAVLGEHDVWFDAHEVRRRLGETVPHATVRLLPDAGHFLADQSGPVQDFILRLDRAPGSRR